MIKKLALLTIVTALTSVSAFADTGIFGSFIVLSINGGPSTFYDLSSATANPDFAGTFLGTFNPAAGDMLVLNGGEVDTFKNGDTGGGTGNNITGANTLFNIHLTSSPQGTFTSIALPFNSEFPAFGTNTGDQKWQETSLGTDLLAGLNPGNYTFEVFSTANWNTDGADPSGTHFASNNSNNYVATFSVVPEPSTLTLLAGPVFLGGWMFLRRRRAS